MKAKISITIEKELQKLIKDKVGEGKFRNVSHLVEYAVSKFIKEERK